MGGGGCNQDAIKMYEHHEEQTRWTHVILKSYSGTCPAHVCSSHRPCMVEFVRLSCRLQMSLFLISAFTLLQTSKNGLSAGTCHGRKEKTGCCTNNALSRLHHAGARHRAAFRAETPLSRGFILL